MVRPRLSQKTNEQICFFFAVKRKKAKKTANLFVRFLGESTARQSAYGFIRTLACQTCKQMVLTLDDFRLGIQKCRKTIQATVQDDRIFHLQGIDSMFKSLRQAADQMDRAKNSTTVKNSQ